jgi:arylsulfatase A-like enzyme
MASSKFSRREFLKLLSLFALGGLASSKTKVPGLRRETLRSQTGATPIEVKSSAPEDQAGGEKKLPNILLLVFDTFSAHHISLYGYRRNTTPNLAKFADQATVFHQHHSGGNFTVPGTSSLLTGTYPWTHRALHFFGTVQNQFVDRNIFSVFADDYFISVYTQNALVMDLFNQFQKYIDRVTPPGALALVSEALADRVFSKDYFISFWGERIVRGSGFQLPDSLFLSYTSVGEDFDPKTPDYLMKKYGELFPRGMPTHSTGLFFLLEDAINWIRGQVENDSRPFLGYFHLLPPHEPYHTRKEFIDIFKDGWKPTPKPILRYSQNLSQDYLDEQSRYYDEYISYVDEEFGRLIDSLDKSGALENTCVILTSDHGQLFERGIHGHVTPTLYEPLIHIPLLISKPGQTAREDIYTHTSAVDVLPTLCQIAGKPVPEWTEGQVLPGFGGVLPDNGRKIYVVEAKLNPKSGPIKIGTTAMIQGDHKLVRYFGYQSKDAYELYDLYNDPDEMVDRFEPNRGSLSDELKGELVAKLDQENQTTF